MIIQLKANAICPQIKLENDLFKFGDCSVRDSREQTFKISNKNPSSKVDISFQKIPNFSMKPAFCSLRPNETSEVKILFEPKTIGKIDSTQKLYINKIYDIDLRLFGIATSEESKNKSRKRIESIKDSPNLGATTKMEFKTRSKAMSVAEKTFVSDMRNSSQQAELMKLELESYKSNKNRFNKYLIDRRTDRVDREKEEVVQKKWTLFQTKLHDLGVGGKYE